MSRLATRTPVKVALLDLLTKGTEPYSGLVKKLRRPDKTVYVTLKALAAGKLVAKDGEGRYAITDAGRNELERIRLIRMVEREDNPEIISRLGDLHLALAKARKTPFP